MPERRWILASKTSAAASLASWWVYTGRLSTYFGYFKNPPAGNDRTLPFSVKGLTVYITHTEQLELTILLYVSIFCGIFAFLIMGIVGKHKYRSM